MNKKAFTVAILSIIIGGSGTFIYIDNSTNIFNDNRETNEYNLDIEFLKGLCKQGDIPDRYAEECEWLERFP